VKKMLSVEDIESQTAFALPDREMMAIATGGLVNVAVDRVEIVKNVDVNVDVHNVLNNNVVRVCAIVENC